MFYLGLQEEDEKCGLFALSLPWKDQESCTALPYLKLIFTNYWLLCVVHFPKDLSCQPFDIPIQSATSIFWHRTENKGYFSLFSCLCGTVGATAVEFFPLSKIMYLFYFFSDPLNFKMCFTLNTFLMVVFWFLWLALLWFFSCLMQSWASAPGHGVNEWPETKILLCWLFSLSLLAL